MIMIMRMTYRPYLPTDEKRQNESSKDSLKIHPLFERGEQEKTYVQNKCHSPAYRYKVTYSMPVCSIILDLCA